MEENHLVSIIVPVFNTEQYLDKCIESIISQDYKTLEILLINDESTDKSLEICKKYSKKDKRIRIFSKNNEGLSSSRNLGLDNAKGDYVYFVDSDDWIDNNTISTLLDSCIRLNTEICCCEGIKTDGVKNYGTCFQCLPTGSIESKDMIVRKMLSNEIMSHVVKAIYKKECWNHVRFPVGRLYEDIPTTFLAFSNANNISFVDKPLYKYRVNTQGISHSPNKEKPFHIFLGFSTQYEYSLKYYPDVSSVCLANACSFALSVVFHYYTDATKELVQYTPICTNFLELNRKNINFRLLKRSRRFLLRLFFISKKAFIFVCKILKITKLQKLLRLEAK